MTPETLTQFCLQERSAWEKYAELAKSGQRHDADLMASVRLRWEQASAFMERAMEQALRENDVHQD